MLIGRPAPILRYALVDGGDTHAAADAERNQTITALYAIELVQNLGRQDGAGGSYGVAQGDRPSHGVDLVVWYIQVPLNGKSNRGKCLVRFDDVHVVYREPGLLQRLVRGGDHTYAHDRRIYPGHRRRDQPAGHRKPQLLGLASAGNERHRRAVVNAASAGGRGHPILLEERLELGEAFLGSSLPDVLVLGELDGLLLLLDLDRHYLVVEVALIPGLLGTLVAPCRVLVNLVTAQAVLLGDVLSGHAHVVVVELIPQPIVDHVVQDLSVRQPHSVAVAPLRQQERRHIHVLDAAREDDVRLPERDLLGRRDDGLQPRGAHPVEGHGRGGVRNP